MARLLMFSLLLFLFGLPVQADGFPPRPSKTVFVRGTKEHIGRLPVYGKRIFLEKIYHFKGLGALPRPMALQLIELQFSMHDFPKTIEDLEELKELGYEGDRTFLDQLIEIWGKRVRPPFIDEMNEFEHRVIKQRMMARLKELGVDPAWHARILEDLDILELVSDIVDTKWHRGKELDFEYHLYDAAKFFAERKKLEAADLARWYEGKYYSGQSGGGRACHSAHP